MVEVHPDLSTVCAYSGEDTGSGDDAAEIAQLYGEARKFLVAHKWCKEIAASYIGFAHPGIVGVFLFRIVPTHEDVDDWVWIIVGDLPPAYITCDKAINPAAALSGYMGALEEWINAVKQGKSVTGLIPINADPIPKFATMLEKRVKFMDERILPLHR